MTVTDERFGAQWSADGGVPPLWWMRSAYPPYLFKSLLRW